MPLAHIQLTHSELDYLIAAISHYWPDNEEGNWWSTREHITHVLEFARDRLRAGEEDVGQR